LLRLGALPAVLILIDDLVGAGTASNR